MGIMMKCGHSANATSDNGSPCCVICVGIHPGAEVIDNNPPLFDGRMAECFLCKRLTPSNPDLFFFKHLPNAMYDAHSCGCTSGDWRD